MDTIPEIRYARNGDVHIAYQTFGEGDVALVGVPPFVSNIETIWEEPRVRLFVERFGMFSRFIHFDKRGTGMSDRDVGVPTLEERIDDLRAVMDAQGIERAVIGGISEGGPMSALFAATYPERTEALILIASFARLAHADDHPWAPPPDLLWQLMDTWADHWGTPDTLTVPLFAPSTLGDEGYLRWVNRYERRTASPGTLRALSRLNTEIDVRSVLPTIRVPTLVLHRRDDLVVPFQSGAYLADHIPGARFVELDGMDHLPWIGDQDTIFDQVEPFVSGDLSRRTADRVLATVLFTDIVSSTAHAASLGDRPWRTVLDSHDALTRREVAAFGGRVVKSTGDGFLLTFDGPTRAVRCATQLCAAARGLGIDLRAGLHTGEIEIRGDDVAGIAVHIAQRVEALAQPGEVLVSRTVKDLVVGSGIDFVDLGTHALKGVTDGWDIHRVG